MSGYNSIDMENIAEKIQKFNGCILIPAYNEELHLAQVIQNAKKFLPVIVVDDGSVDATFQISQDAGATVIKQIPNQGKGAALQRGLRESLAMGFDFVITMDADGQHNPDEISKFLESYASDKNDLIIGYRDFSKMPFIRRLANTIGGWLFAWAMRVPIKDNQSGYRLLSKDLITKVLDSSEHGFEYEVEMIVRCIKSNLRIGWVPIQTIYADETSHIQPVHHFKNFMRVIFSTRKRMRDSKNS